jgi:hypothetical protein
VKLKNKIQKNSIERKKIEDGILKKNYLTLLLNSTQQINLKIL